MDEMALSIIGSVNPNTVSYGTCFRKNHRYGDGDRGQRPGLNTGITASAHGVGWRQPFAVDARWLGRLFEVGPDDFDYVVGGFFGGL
jgi:hypothetical protein